MLALPVRLEQFFGSIHFYRSNAGKYREKLRLDFCSIYINNHSKKGKKKKKKKNMALDIVMRDNPLKPPNNLGRPHVETRVFGWGD